MNLTDDEKKLVAQFIFTSIQQYSQEFIVNTFISMLENDAATMAFIKQQLAAYLSASSVGVQAQIDALEAQKLATEAALQAQKEAMDGFITKIETP